MCLPITNEFRKKSVSTEYFSFSTHRGMKVSIKAQKSESRLKPNWKNGKLLLITTCVYKFFSLQLFLEKVSFSCKKRKKGKENKKTLWYYYTFNKWNGIFNFPIFLRFQFFSSFFFYFITFMEFFVLT